MCSNSPSDHDGVFLIGKSKERITVRVLLRDMASKQYFARKGGWATEAKRAFDFRTTKEAIARAGEVGRDGLEIVLSFEDVLDEVVVPVSKATDPSGWRRERRERSVES
jgi:hypothetical protein